MTARKKPTRRNKATRNATRKKRSKPLTKMNAAELANATAELNEEFVADSFGEPDPDQKARLERAKRKRGRPQIGKGVRIVSVSIERGLLERTDRLAKKLKVRRSALISRGLEAVLKGQVAVDHS